MDLFTRVLCHGHSPGKNTAVGYYALLWGIFLTQRSDPGLPHCRHFLYYLSLQESSRIRMGSLSLLQGVFLTQETDWGLPHCRRILDQLSYQGSPMIQNTRSSKLPIHAVSKTEIHSEHVDKKIWFGNIFSLKVVKSKSSLILMIPDSLVFELIYEKSRNVSN